VRLLIVVFVTVAAFAQTMSAITPPAEAKTPLWRLVTQQ
jgi:hypothetical protein